MKDDIEIYVDVSTQYKLKDWIQHTKNTDAAPHSVGATSRFIKLRVFATPLNRPKEVQFLALRSHPRKGGENEVETNKNPPESH